MAAGGTMDSGVNNPNLMGTSSDGMLDSSGNQIYYDTAHQ